MTQIYTKTGDCGYTSLLRGERVLKSNPRVEAYGTIDELNSILGIVRAYGRDKSFVELIKSIQSHLCTIQSMLAATSHASSTRIEVKIAQEDVAFLEHSINQLEKKLPPLQNFILPGETCNGAYLDLARTICRRAERRVVELAVLEKIDAVILQYLNRLSDFFFMLERLEYYKENKKETRWGKNTR